MASEVGICNSGLIALGENTIISLSDNSKPARTCNAIYEDKRNWLIRSYEWKFAIKRTNISPLAESPDHEWANQFQLPTDLLRFLSIYPSSVLYKIEGNKILSNETVLYIKYLYQVTDPNEFDEGFKETLGVVMAKEMAIALTDSARKQKAMEDLFEVKLSDARYQGSIEDDLERFEADDWEESRL